MILTLWSSFVGLAVILFVIGYYMRNDMLRILATLLFFLMGQVLEFSGVEYIVGQTANITLNSTILAYQYSTYTSHIFGFYMSIVGLLTFVYILFERRNQK